ncbi:MAG: HlyD family efflux transporter periplasmic adaptor subunit [Planctomycetota bacterium]|nr:HlyD family efflux transporter periplasmic adaptor subunit [Planctomycetota bacterium]
MSAEIEQPPEGSVGEVANLGDPAVDPAKARKSRLTNFVLSNRRTIFIVLFIVIAALSTLMLFPKTKRRAADLSGGSFSGLELHTVDRIDFDMIIPVSGELAALRQVEVRNLLEGRSVITEIVAEGQRVQQGDVLVKFASEESTDKIKDMQDKLKTAQAEAIANEQALAIKQNERLSEIEKAELQVKLGKLALEGWKNGELVSKRQQQATALEAATIDAARQRKRFGDSEALVAKGFISRDEYEKDRISLIQADARVKQTALDIDVYEKFQMPQDEAKKISDLEQALAEQNRTEQKKNSEIVKAQSDLESSQFRSKTALERLTQGQRQLENTTIISPTDGLVVYASSLESGGWGRGGDAPPPGIGTELKPNELVMIIPDVSQMVAYLKVSEALSGRIKPDQEVTIFSDANPTVPIRGTVMNVSVLAESGGWRDPNRRDYKVRVLLDDVESLALKPSMRCKASILLGRATDVLSIPVQAVFRQGVASFVYVPDSDGFSQRQVTLGRSSEMDIEVMTGLDEGEQVLLREPAAEEVISRLPTEITNPKEQDATKTSASPQGKPTGESNQTQRIPPISTPSVTGS